jgi:hypothetical protein
METVSTALKTALTGIGSDISGIVGDVLPIGLGIVGTVMVVTFGVKFFKKLTGKA